MRKSKLFLVAAFIALAVNGKGDLEYARSSRESLTQALERMDIQIGSDLERGRIVAIGTSGFHIKGGNSDGEWVNEAYDFPDDANDDFETKRFKAVWKAYANGLAEIATLVAASINSTETENKDGKVVSMATAKAAS